MGQKFHNNDNSKRSRNDNNYNFKNMKFVWRTFVLLLLRQGQICGQRYEYINNDYIWNQNYDDDGNEWVRLETEDLRFNKFYFPRYALPPKGFKPLKKNDYPISGFVNETLRTSNAYSVITPDDYEIVYSVPRLIEAVGGLPPQPEANVNAEFWDLLRHVIDVQEIRETRPFTRLFPLPDLWKNADLNQIADYVHNEYPGTNQSLLLADILKEKYGEVVIDYNSVPYRTDSMFLRKDFMLASINTWAMSIVGPYNFAAKWYCGRARPEEVVWAIKRGRITKGVPHDIQRKVANLDISNAREFTAYKEDGCPRHPSWPAMHAASTSISFWLSIVLEINDEQLCQARLMDYGISYARTVAGVHYEDDNIAGMNMAQEVLARALPKYLKERYNADPKAVARKIYKNRFDWRNFDPNDPCPFLRRST